jgi:cytochrome c oxidase subunit IV
MGQILAVFVHEIHEGRMVYAIPIVAILTFVFKCLIADAVSLSCLVNSCG